jgi:glycerol kinase
MTASDWTMQRIADLLGAPVDRPVVRETTALGAAWLAGFASGVVPGPEGFGELWSLDRRFEPEMEPTERQRRLALWDEAVRRTLGATSGVAGQGGRAAPGATSADDLRATPSGGT